MIDAIRREAEVAAERGPREHASALARLAYAQWASGEAGAVETLARAFSVASAEPAFEDLFRLDLAVSLLRANADDLARAAFEGIQTLPDTIAVEDTRDELSLRRTGSPPEAYEARSRRLLFGRDQHQPPLKERVLHASQGEITRADALDEKGNPAPGGPRCVRIFGPLSSYQCLCGRYSGQQFQGVVCERCHVELVDRTTRTRRLGHVSLGCRVLHPWFFERAAAVLELQLEQLLEVLDREGAETLADRLEQRGAGRLVLEVLAIPPPEGPVPGGHSTHDAVEASLRVVLEASKKARSFIPKKANGAALQRAVTAWFSNF